VTDIDLTGWLEGLDALHSSDDAEYLYDWRTDGGGLRRANLLRYLELLAEREPSTMVIGEAPGYRGTTVTGIPFTSIRQLQTRPGLITRADAGDGFRMPDTPSALWEASSGAMWQALSLAPDGALPLLWSAYPNHPHDRGNPLTNRKPRPAEVALGAPIALELGRLFGIRNFVAVGRTAEAALGKAGLTVTAVRHPSQGGARIFADQMRELLAPGGAEGAQNAV
jgi:hypothetical protein